MTAAGLDRRTSTRERNSSGGPRMAISLHLMPVAPVMSSPSDPAFPSEPLTRGQWLVLASLVFVGAWLRLDGLSEASLSHFDEGVYLVSAYNAYFEGPWAFRLKLPFQAPPFYPWSVASIFALTGDVSPTTGLLTSALAGTATIPLMFTLVRRIRGNRFGLAAAALLAFSDLHIAYSRAALTDALFTFWFLLAQLAIDRLLTGLRGTGGRVMAAYGARTVAAGLLVGAAWNTKYNGWMPVAIGMVAVALLAARRQVVRRSDPGQGRPFLVLGCLVVAGLIAAAAFLPWYFYVERSFPGGYAAVVANHLSYLGSVGDWPGRALRLAAAMPAYRHAGWVVLIGLGAAAWPTFVPSFVRSHPPSEGAGRLARVALGLVAFVIAFVEGTDLVVFLLAVAGILPAVVRGGRREVWLAVWVGAFVILVPVYHPYVRLLLPGLPAAICLGLLSLCRGLGMAVSGSAVPANRPGGLWPPAIALGAGVVLAVAVNPFGVIPSKSLWGKITTRRSYRELGDITDRITPEDAVVLLKTSPAAWPYAVRSQVLLERESIVEAAARVPAGRPVYVALDYQAVEQPRRDGAESLNANLACLTPEAVVPNDLNLISLLDHLTPWEAAGSFRAGRRSGKTARTADGRELPVPTELGSSFEDVIVLYRVDRACVREKP